MGKPKRGGKLGRNDKCLCGSGLKYKKCCLKTLQDSRDLERTKSRKVPSSGRKLSAMGLLVLLMGGYQSVGGKRKDDNI